jgi:peptidoglycan/LPS O-acetylase OafA/YrhL
VYKRLIALNGLAILAVVLNHAGGWGLVAMFWWTHRYRAVSVPNFDAVGTPSYDISMAIHLLTTFAVPAFLFASGFFVAYAAQGNAKRLSWKVVTTRIVAILLPYGIWSGMLFIGDAVQGTTYAPMEYILRLTLMGANGGYYFIPVLCIFYLISPWLVPLARSRWKLLLAVSALVQLIPISFRYLRLAGISFPGLPQLIDWTPDQLFIRWAFFFPLGLVCGLHVDAFGQWLASHRRGLAAGFVAAYGLYLAESEIVFRATPDHWRQGVSGIMFSVYAVMAILAFLALPEGSVPFVKRLGQLGTRSYGIYLLHFTIIEIAARLIYHIAPWMLGVQALLQPLLFVVGLAVPLLLMMAWARSPLRGSYRYLFG